MDGSYPHTDSLEQDSMYQSGLQSCALELYEVNNVTKPRYLRMLRIALVVMYSAVVAVVVLCTLALLCSVNVLV
jgi:hypothetical protein